MLAGISDAADSEPATTPIGLTEPGAAKLTRALLSVSDKRGIVDFARGLAELGVQLVSTGGTAKVLADAGLEVRSIEDFTGFPEIMDGRVKTLHPRLYAGLLAVRSNPEHLAAIAEHEIEEVDLVCVNLYPFESTAARRDATEAQIIENIDIGGPTMIRAAAKNHAFAAVVTSPESYDAVLDELRGSAGLLSMPTRASLAAEAFAYTARYDTAIARWFAEKSEDFPPLHVRAYEKVTDLRYGENPHQRAAYYAQVGSRTHLLSQVRQHHGKELSFNNLLDLDAVRRIVADFTDPACIIVKHNNPCGAALGTGPLQAYERALATDPLSAFGGVIAFNRPVDVATAQRLSEQFVEVLFAPGYEDGAIDVLAAKPSIRILEDNERRTALIAEPDVRQVMGGLLVQDRDLEFADRTEMEIATKRAPSDDEWRDLLFAWQICKHVRSNAIVLAKDLTTAGIGAGQMSRVDSVRLAVDKSRLESLQGAVLASDAFFPFSDGPEIAIGAGVTAIIQPGGSRNDPAVRDAADEAGIAMVFTSRRHFRH
ncbi:MAG TPA: bifunctional phosphoribosylaminoimidazolecarboxamide formyltransferase/IMP cyclohydrolase [Solirubrobacteraceae bacterium]|jgi:phosphoribosylaminoimidazolecarboxamide formyltransferase / IMP cyclohydrolase